MMAYESGSCCCQGTSTADMGYYSEQCHCRVTIISSGGADLFSYDDVDMFIVWPQLLEIVKVIYFIILLLRKNIERKARAPPIFSLCRLQKTRSQK